MEGGCAEGTLAWTGRKGQSWRIVTSLTAQIAIARLGVRLQATRRFVKLKILSIETNIMAK